MNQTHEIVPFTRVGSFVLGMTRQEVLDVAGQPTTKQWDYEQSGEPVYLSDQLPEDCSATSEHWEFEPGFNLSFEADDDFRLCAITCQSREATLDGQILVGLTEASLIKLPIWQGNPLREEVFEETECKGFECDELGLNLWVEGGVVWNFTLFPKYESDGEKVVWPSR